MKTFYLALVLALGLAQARPQYGGAGEEGPISGGGLGGGVGGGLGAEGNYSSSPHADWSYKNLFTLKFP